MSTATVHKTFILPSVWTKHIYEQGDWLGEITYSIYVRDILTSTDYAAYEWTFDSETVSLLGLDGATASSAILSFYYRMAQTGATRSLDVVLLDSQPSTLSARTVGEAIRDGTALTTCRPTGDKKNICTVTLAGDALTKLTTAFSTNGFIGIGLRQTIGFVEQPSCEVGGKTLQEGLGDPWEDADKNDYGIPGPPTLTVTYYAEEADHSVQEMRYTTADPTTEQNSPGSSIGGYVASNMVFTRAQIGDYISSNQTVIPIATWSDLPSDPGGNARAAQIGPEIIRYTGVDSTNRQLTGVTRGIAPANAAFPASIDFYGEYVHYLDISRLFNNTPSVSLSQYRCVAIAQVSGFPIKDVVVELYQNSSVTTQVDIGIEIPAFSSRGEELAGAVASGAEVFYSTGATVVDLPENFFANAYVVIDPFGTKFKAFVQSYVMSEGVAQFTLDRAMPAFADSTAFLIYPAPAQRITSERNSPTSNGRFLGWFSEGGSKEVSYGGLLENAGVLTTNDVFYIWIKRTISTNVKSAQDIGATIAINYELSK